MAGKSRDFGALQAGLATLQQPSPSVPVTVASPPSVPKGRGRPGSDTLPITLRLPQAVYAALVKAAADASIAEGKNVTPQQIIVRGLEATYG